MDTMSMNLENSKTSDAHRLLLNLSDKLDLKRSYKLVALSNLTVYYKWEIIKKSYKSDILNIHESMWNVKFELPDGSYSVSDIQRIIKRNEAVIDNLIGIYVKNRK